MAGPEKPRTSAFSSGRLFTSATRGRSHFLYYAQLHRGCSLGPSGTILDPPWNGLNEADTRAELHNPAIHARGWTENLIKREQTAGAVEIVGSRPRRRNRGRVDYTLRIRVNPGTQPVAVALIEAKAEGLPPDHGLEQAKAYARCKRLNVPFAFLERPSFRGIRQVYRSHVGLPPTRRVSDAGATETAL